MSQPITILLVEDISTVQFFVRNALTALPRPYQLVTCSSVNEARKVIVDRTVDLLIVDIGLPDGDGIDFLCEVAMLQPQATAVIITASPSEENRARAGYLGAVQVLTKPVVKEKLVAACLTLLGWDEQKPEDAPNFRATLSGLTTMDIIQLKCMSGATGILEFTNTRGSGRVYFERGDVVHCMVRSEEDGSKIGYEAFEEIVGWKSGRVAEIVDPVPSPRTIRTGWQSLLLEVAQSRDELHGRAA